MYPTCIPDEVGIYAELIRCTPDEINVPYTEHMLKFREIRVELDAAPAGGIRGWGLGLDRGTCI